jgi:hypothetical protein
MAKAKRAKKQAPEESAFESPAINSPVIEFPALSTSRSQAAGSVKIESDESTKPVRRRRGGKTAPPADAVVAATQSAIAEAIEAGRAQRPLPRAPQLPPRSKVARIWRAIARPASPMAATIVLAACCGAITGSLATVGVAKFVPLDFAISSGADQDVTRHIARIDAEIVGLKSSMGAAARLDTAASETTGSTSITYSAPPAATGSQPGIIPVIEGWVLRNVYAGSALVEGRPGLIQVMPGDNLPGVGRVESIRREDGRWAVVTTRGLIVSR